jgi:DNA polymerase III epsilon subunit-like protein
MLLSRKIAPHEYRHNLDVLSQRLGLMMPTDRHRALPDVLLTAQVLLRLIDIAEIRSLEQLRKMASLPSLSRTR